MGEMHGRLREIVTQAHLVWVCDHLKNATTFPKYQNFPSPIPIVGTSCKRPPPISDHFPLVPKLSQSNRYRWHLSLTNISSKRSLSKSKAKIPIKSLQFSYATTRPINDQFPRNVPNFPSQIIMVGTSCS